MTDDIAREAFLRFLDQNYPQLASKLRRGRMDVRDLVNVQTGEVFQHNFDRATFNQAIEEFQRKSSLHYGQALARESTEQARFANQARGRAIPRGGRDAPTYAGGRFYPSLGAAFQSGSIPRMTTRQEQDLETGRGYDFSNQTSRQGRTTDSDAQVENMIPDFKEMNREFQTRVRAKVRELGTLRAKEQLFNTPRRGADDVARRGESEQRRGDLGPWGRSLSKEEIYRMAIDEVRKEAFKSYSFGTKTPAQYPGRENQTPWYKPFVRADWKAAIQAEQAARLVPGPSVADQAGTRGFYHGFDPGNAVMPSGKYKGIALRDLPDDYVARTLVNREFKDPAFNKAVEAYLKRRSRTYLIRDQWGRYNNAGTLDDLYGDRDGKTGPDSDRFRDDRDPSSRYRGTSQFDREAAGFGGSMDSVRYYQLADLWLLSPQEAAEIRSQIRNNPFMRQEEKFELRQKLKHSVQRGGLRETYQSRRQSLRYPKQYDPDAWFSRDVADISRTVYGRANAAEFDPLTGQYKGKKDPIPVFYKKQLKQGVDSVLGQGTWSALWSPAAPVIGWRKDKQGQWQQTAKHPYEEARQLMSKILYGQEARGGRPEYRGIWQDMGGRALSKQIREYIEESLGEQKSQQALRQAKRRAFDIQVAYRDSLLQSGIPPEQVNEILKQSEKIFKRSDRFRNLGYTGDPDFEPYDDPDKPPRVRSVGQLEKIVEQRTRKLIRQIRFGKDAPIADTTRLYPTELESPGYDFRDEADKRERGAVEAYRSQSLHREGDGSGKTIFDQALEGRSRREQMPLHEMARFTNQTIDSPEEGGGGVSPEVKRLLHEAPESFGVRQRKETLKAYEEEQNLSSYFENSPDKESVNRTLEELLSKKKLGGIRMNDDLRDELKQEAALRISMLMSARA